MIDGHPCDLSLPAHVAAARAFCNRAVQRTSGMNAIEIARYTPTRMWLRNAHSFALSTSDWSKVEARRAAPRAR
jgi:hypothetical protein